jgi:hypothetical protein
MMMNSWNDENETLVMMKTIEIREKGLFWGARSVTERVSRSIKFNGITFTLCELSLRQRLHELRQPSVSANQKIL